MGSKNAFIVVDVQNDFLPGGALAVPEGDQIIPVINTLVELPFDFVVGTRDFHPEKHCSFATTWQKQVGDRIRIGNIEQIMWPEHCVQGSKGAEFPHKINSFRYHEIISKGTAKNVDSYSTFFDNRRLKSTGLEDHLRNRGIHDVYFAGLATDYCVLYSVRDAVELGFQVYVVIDACRGINLNPGDVERAFVEMRQLGAKLVTSQDVIDRFIQANPSPTSQTRGNVVSFSRV